MLIKKACSGLRADLILGSQGSTFNGLISIYDYGGALASFHHQLGKINYLGYHTLFLIGLSG